MTIPVSQIVKITPSALSAAPSVGFMNGLILTNNTLQAGTLKEYGDAASVAKYFNATSNEAKMAAAYFSGYVGASQTPSKLYIYAVNSTFNISDLDNVVNELQDFAGFTTSFELSSQDKQSVAQWVAAQQDNYWAVIWDTDAEAIATSPSENCFGVWLKNQNIDGVTAVYQDPAVAAACLGWMASLDFELTNGRATLSTRSFAGATATDGSLSDYEALIQNGYNLYGAFANRTARFNLLRPGSVSGEFNWADSYICQMWLNASLQNALINLITDIGQIPYNTDGDGLMTAAILDIVEEARNFGAINTGIKISSEEASILQSKFGRDISQDLFTQGYCFQPNASTTPSDIRRERGSPPCIFAYCDGGSIQTINLPSIGVQ
ncbi:DUF3383 domain-containing protein [Acetobacteraceae bacterium]|nr:DUF3383 domain-containing protein [Acetobacteraceae bacterium]